MQNLLSYFIVFIISVFLIVNASASVSSCANMMDEPVSMSQAAGSEAMTGVDNDLVMTAIHDCCEIKKAICDHGNACDCDNSQANYSAIPAIQIVSSQYIDSFKPRYISSLFHSKISDSLYRPPITTLI